MKKNKNNNLQLRNGSTFLESVVATFLFVLIIFISVFSRPVGFCEIDIITKYSNQQNNAYHSGINHLTKLQNHFPIDSSQQSSWKKLSDENELSEDTDDNIDFLDDIPLFEKFRVTKGINFYLHQLTQSLHNGNTIALFVLHHSWKSFLS